MRPFEDNHEITKPVWSSQPMFRLPPEMGYLPLQVGFRRVIGLPGDYSYQWRERQLLAMITAEGPTCVLTIADMQVCAIHLHPQLYV